MNALRLLAAAAVVMSLSALARADDAIAGVRRFEITYAASVKEWPKDAKQVVLWVPLPSPTTAQAVSDVEIQLPDGWAGRQSCDDDGKFGNRVLCLTPSMHRAFTVTVKCRVQRREVRALAQDRVATMPAGATEPPDPIHLRPDRLGVVDDRVRKLAQEITAGRRGELEQARAIYDYVLAHMAYDKAGTGWGRGDTLRACDVGRGNCTDFHALFISLARARGIPARLRMGASLPVDQAQGELAGYHCWAEFWVGGRGWVPVDASEAWKHPKQREFLFGNLDANRVEFSVGRDLILPGMRGEPLTFMSGPYAEADGKPLAAVEKSVRFKEI